LTKLSKGRIAVGQAPAELLANAVAAQTFVFGLPNDSLGTMDEHGWTKIPYGVWQHTKGYQRFGQKEAEAIVDFFKSGWAKLKRAIIGPAIYKGHPDNPDMANLYPDKTKYGTVCDMRVEDDGLSIRQALTEEGGKLVANGRDRISPNWWVRDTGEKKNGMPIFEPIAIKSVGLVDKPNIPNLSLVNSAENDPMKELLIKLLALANEATEAQVVEAVTALARRPEETALANAKNEKAVLESRVAALTAERDAEKARADAGATALANERTVKLKAVIDGAIRDGRITAAQRPMFETILANNFDEGSKIMAGLKPTVKVKPRVDSATAAEADRKAREAFANGDANAGDESGGADQDGNQISNARKIQKLVDAEMHSMCANIDHLAPGARNSLRNRAWANVKRQMPKLFDPGDYSKKDESRDGGDDPSGK
jgi:hypothetical protein